MRDVTFRFGLPALLAALLTAGTCTATTDPGGLLGINATVEFAQVGSGCWTLAASDGARYEPLDLPKEFRQNGVEVRVRLDEVDNVASTCMVGRVVEIIEIRRS